jgi:hypothetical protein
MFFPIRILKMTLISKNAYHALPRFFLQGELAVQEGHGGKFDEMLEGF